MTEKSVDVQKGDAGEVIVRVPLAAHARVEIDMNKRKITIFNLVISFFSSDSA
jgi:hypothetical protein